MDCHLDETNRILCITEAVHEAVMNVRIFVNMTARPLEAHTRPSATLGVSPLDTTMRGRSAQLGTSPEALVRTLRTALSLSRAMPSQFSVAQVNAVRRVTEGFQELFPPSSEYPLEGECDESADEELTLDKMPTEMIVRILLCLPTSDIGTMDCVCRAFHGERPTATLPSPIEQALRERAVLRGERMEIDRPKGGPSWTQSLCWRERLITLPRKAVAAGWSHLACVTQWRGSC